MKGPRERRKHGSCPREYVRSLKMGQTKSTTRVMRRVSVRPHILQENKVMGPLTQVECLMDIDWALAWKHPSFDRREVPPLHGRVLLVVPVQSLLTRSRIFSCQRKVGYWEHFQVLSEVTLSRQQMSGPCWHERW